MVTTSSLRILGLAAGLVVMAVLPSCATKHTQWTGAETVKRNTVELVRLTHDVVLDENGGFSDAQRDKLDGFLANISFGYGDELSIDPGDAPGAEARRTAIASHLRAMGIPVSPRSVVYGGRPEANGVRIVVGRYVVTPPHCPDWSKPASPDYTNTASSNFGCATATDIGLMVANPRDLIQGRGDVTMDAELAARAVKNYREGKTKELESVQTQGNQGGSGSGNNQGGNSQ